VACARQTLFNWKKVIACELSAVQELCNEPLGVWLGGWLGCFGTSLFLQYTGQCTGCVNGKLLNISLHNFQQPSMCQKKFPIPKTLESSNRTHSWRQWPAYKACVQRHQVAQGWGAWTTVLLLYCCESYFTRSLQIISIILPLVFGFREALPIIMLDELSQFGTLCQHRSSLYSCMSVSSSDVSSSDSVDPSIGSALLPLSPHASTPAPASALASMFGSGAFSLEPEPEPLPLPLPGAVPVGSSKSSIAATSSEPTVPSSTELKSPCSCLVTEVQAQAESWLSRRP